MKKLLTILLVISISLSCLLIATELVAFNLELYNRSFIKHNIEEVSGKNLEDLDTIAEDLVLYLDGKASEEILQANFNEREVLHMVDVKELFSWGKLIRRISVVLTIILGFYFYGIKKRKYAKFVFLGLFANWIILGLFGIMIYFDFNKYFTIFHHIFFTNDLWLLNPKTDLLIQMLPEAFFMSMATRIVVYFLIFIAIIQAILFIMMKTNKRDVERA